MRPLDQLNAKFSIKDHLRFDTGQGGLTRAVISTPAASAQIYLHGAHVTHYAGTGQAPLLFLSKQSHFMSDKPIRGGVPICFPWFGPKNDPDHPDAPIHGFARVMPWTVEATSIADDAVTLVLGLKANAQTKKQWPFDFVAQYSVTVGQALALQLTVSNPGSASITFEEALHTYFAVGDVRTVWADGLGGATYIDKTDKSAKKTQDAAVRITAETDRLYLDTQSTITLHDPSQKRKIVVEKQGSNSSVVWNPWIAKAKAMSDFGDDEWPEMLCIETVNANANAVTVAPGQSHTLKAIISSAAL